jgi:FkbM family methyltransferase
VVAGGEFEMVLPYWLDAALWYGYHRWRGRKVQKSRFMLRRAARNLRRGDIVVDCGANVGDVTAVFAATGATVHAFEPHPVAFGVLSSKVSMFPNVVLHNSAVGLELGRLPLFLSSDEAGDELILTQSSSMFSGKRNVTASKSVDVSVICFEDFLRSLDGFISVIKIDIEGMEVPLLESLLVSDLMDRIGVILVETHERKVPELYERTMKLREICRNRYPKRIFLDWH